MGISGAMLKKLRAVILAGAWCLGLFVPTVFGGEAVTLVSATHLKTKYPQQMELQAFERFLGESVTIRENPIFKDLVSKGKLAPVEKRIPQEPLVVIPNEKIGRYGGTLNGLALSYESGTSEILSWRQANLVRFSDDNRTIVPNVVKSWKWSDDYTQITFYLRKGHRWSDGHPFTADDLVFYMNDIILNRDIHPEVPTPWQGMGATIEKIDDVTVKFSFEKPFTSLLFYLGGNGSYHDVFAPKHFLKKFHIRYNPDVNQLAKEKGFENWVDLFKSHWNKWKDAIVNKASGLDVPTLESHILKEVPTESGRLFVANPYYFKIDTAGNQLPYITYHRERFLPKSKWIDEIINGRVDQKSQNMPLNSYPILKAHQQKGQYVLQTPTTGSGPAIFFNKTHKDIVKRKIFQDPRFNWAVSLSLNRKQINKELFLGLCRPGQALPQNVGFVTDDDQHFMIAYDPSKANAFLDEMGLKRGNDGYRLRPDGRVLTINWEYTLQYVWSKQLPKMIQKYLADVGLKMVLSQVSTKIARTKQLNNDLDISNEWAAPFEPTLFSTPQTFMPPYGVAYPVTDIAWYQWKNSAGQEGEAPPQWVKNLWEIGNEFMTLVPGSDWYNALGRRIIDLNLSNLSGIGTLSDVPLITIVSNRLGNVPEWKINSYYYGYAYPYRADQWYFK